MSRGPVTVADGLKKTVHPILSNLHLHHLPYQLLDRILLLLVLYHLILLGIRVFETCDFLTKSILDRPFDEPWTVRDKTVLTFNAASARS